MSKLSKTANNCLDNFFMTRGLALEEGNVAGAYSKQMALSALLSEVKNWISLKPHGVFKVLTYDEEKGDPIGLILMNCVEESVKFEYEITIAPTWEGFRACQISESGEHKIELLMFEL